MQLHISPSLRHVTVLPAKGVREFIKVKIGSRRLTYRMVFYSVLLFIFLFRFVFVLTAVDTIDGETKCSTIGCLRKRLRPRMLGRRLDSTEQVPEVIYQVLEEPVNQSAEEQLEKETPQTLEDFIAEIKDERPDPKAFALKLKSMITLLEKRTRSAKIQEYLYRHVASSSIPKQLHCLALRLANEHSTNAKARIQLPSAELVPALVDNSFFHFMLASDNVLAASVVASSLVRNALHPEKIVLHIITDRKTYYPMQAWFSLHSLTPAIIEVKALHHFDWFTKGKIPFLLLQNLKSDLSLWQLGTLPPGLIAFHGHVHIIDPFWHMLGLGYQENTTTADAESAGVIHYNGRAKPWLDIAFPQLRSLWTKYIDFSDRFIKSCHIRES